MSWDDEALHRMFTNYLLDAVYGAGDADGHMKKEPETARIDELREEYDFSGRVRGKYAERCAEGTNIVVLSSILASPRCSVTRSR